MTDNKETNGKRFKDSLLSNIWIIICIGILIFGIAMPLGTYQERTANQDKRIEKIEVTQEKIFEWMNKKDVSDAIQAKNIEVIKEAVVKEEKNK